MTRLAVPFAVATLTILPILSMPTAAAELRVLSLPPLRSAMTELLPPFERSSNHQVRIDYGTPPQLAERLQKGEQVDVLIATKPIIAKLQGERRLTGTSDIAKVGMGLAVRQGAAKPAIDSTEAFKRALLDAKSIAYIDPASGAPGGIYLAKLFERLGIAAALKVKTRHFGPSGAEAAVAKGEVELALSQITVIRNSPGVDLVGPLPAEIQNYLQFSAGAVVGGQSEAAQALVGYLASPRAMAVMKPKGFE